jgi:hypothetical protein
MMNNVQLYLAIGLPIFANAAMFGLLLMYRNVRFDPFERRFDARFESIKGRFEGIDQRSDAINRRFDDMRDLWRAELHRVEEVLDARLKHIEDARR